MKKLIVPVLIALALATCAAAMGRKDAKERDAHADSILTTGVRGRVEIWQGNFMPMTDPNSTNRQILPGAGLKVRLYMPVEADRALSSAHRDSIDAVLIAETTTDSTGHFHLAAKPGHYSIFIEDGNGWYSNSFDGKGIQGSVTVESTHDAEILIKNTTKATY